MFNFNPTPEQVIEFNQLVDKYHDPRYWSIFGFLSLVFILEVFLPIKKSFNGYFDQVLSYFKFGVLLFTSLIVASQSFLGGCLIQIPQNWLAQRYLGQPYWYPFGLVYRENFPESFWPYLRLIYLFLAILYFYFLYKYYQRRLFYAKN